MSQGTVGWWVLGMYLRSVGIFLSVIIIISLILMQLSQNFTFLWLAYWVKNRTNNATTLNSIGLLESPHEVTNILDHGVNAIDSIVHTIVNTTMMLINANLNSSGLINLQETNQTQIQETVTSNGTLLFDDTFYLEVYFGLASLNLVFTVIRAFLFAYGGVQAATRIHKVLLKVIVKVNKMVLLLII